MSSCNFSVPVTICTLLLLINVCSLDNTTENTVIVNVYAITTSFSVGESLTRGHKLAIDAINEDATILPSYYLNLTVLPSEEDSTTALLHALEVSRNSKNRWNTERVYDLPILLGCDWSTMSTVTSPALSAFEWAQISSSSTSLILSATTSYPYFYRTISDDKLQAYSLVELCKAFNWDRIGIMHVNDNYGVYLAVAISELATSSSIQVNSIAFQRNNNESYANAVRSMKEINIYIIIIISHGMYIYTLKQKPLHVRQPKTTTLTGDDDIKHIFHVLRDLQMLQYPYFYIATDAWMDAKVIHRITSNFTDYQGIIGTLPWQPIQSSTWNASMYTETNLTTMYETACMAYRELQELHSLHYGHNSTLGTRLIYGFDTVMVLAKVLSILDTTYGFGGLLNMSHTEWIKIIHHIMLHEIEFESVTGLLSFENPSGNRQHGMYSFGYITHEGEIEYFGYSYSQTTVTDVPVWGGSAENNGSDTVAISSTEHKAVINQDLILWPDRFVENGIIPQSSALQIPKLLTITEEVWITMTAIACFGIFCVFVYWIYLCFFAKKLPFNIKLNILIHIGIILAYLYIILRGLDERKFGMGSPTLDILCNVNVWLMVFAFTLVFTPIFAKTYKLTRIFTELRITKSVPDSVLLMRVAIALGIDVLFLVVFVSLQRFTRVYKEGDVEIIDELQKRQIIYGLCEMADRVIHGAFWICIGVWKLVEMIFGIYVSMIVSRMSFKSHIWIMGAVLVIIVFAIILFAFGPVDDPDYSYLLSSISIVLVIHLLLFSKYARRLQMQWEIKHNEHTTWKQEDLDLNDELRMKKLLQERLQEIARSENWASEIHKHEAGTTQ